MEFETDYARRWYARYQADKAISKMEQALLALAEPLLNEVNQWSPDEESALRDLIAHIASRHPLLSA